MVQKRTHVSFSESLLTDIDALFGKGKRSSFLTEIPERENWGAKQTGFSDLGKLAKDEVTKILTDGVAKSNLKFRVNDKGHTIYGLSKWQ